MCFKRYAWPGNVRELEHAITRATVLAQDATVTLADLPVRVRAAFFEPAAAPAAPTAVAALAAAGSAPTVGADGVDLNAALEQIERQLIAEALEKTGGNKNRAAALLKYPPHHAGREAEALRSELRHPPDSVKALAPANRLTLLAPANRHHLDAPTELLRDIE